MTRRKDDDVRAAIDVHHEATRGRFVCWGWGADSGGSGIKTVCDGCTRTTALLPFDDLSFCWRCAYERHLPGCPLQNSV